MLEYEIVDLRGENLDELECIITQLGKKKQQRKYKVVWKLEEQKIVASSIDINNAVVLITDANEKVAEENSKAEAERLVQEEAARVAKEQAEAERLAKEEAERVAKEQAEAERLAKEETERVAKEQAEAERLAKEEAERVAKEQAEAERLAKEEAARVAKAQAEAERLAKEEAERVAKAQVEAERFAEEEATQAIATVYEESSKSVGKSTKEGKKKSYKQYVELSVKDGEFVGVNYIGGCKIGKCLFLGVGTGVDYGGILGWEGDSYMDYDGYFRGNLGTPLVSIPVYVDFRVNLLKKKWSPYISASVGYRFSQSKIDLIGYWDAPFEQIKVNSGRPVLNIGLGVNRTLNERHDLYLGINCSPVRSLEYEVHSDGAGYSVELAKSTYIDYYLGLNLGFSF